MTKLLLSYVAFWTWGHMGDHARWLIGTIIAFAGLVIALLAWQFPRSLQTAPHPSGSFAAAPSSARTGPKTSVKNVALDQVRVGECLGGPSLIEMMNSKFNYWPNSAELVACNVNHIAEVLLTKSDLSKPDASSGFLCRFYYAFHIGARRDYSVYSQWWHYSQGAKGYTLKCFVYSPKSSKPWYKILDRPLKGIKK